MRASIILSIFVIALCGCSRVGEQGTAPDRFAEPALTEAKILTSRYYRIYHLEDDGKLKSDEPVLIGASGNLQVIKRDDEYRMFDSSSILKATAHHVDDGIQCLCAAEFTRGLALYDQWYEHIGWVLFSRNHNMIQIRDAHGRTVSQYRFQRTAPGQSPSIFSKIEDTVDLRAVLHDFGLIW